MLSEMEIICRTAAEQAALELSQRSFGAVDAVEFDGIAEGRDEGQRYYVAGWRVVSLSGLDSVVRMVILPEFLTEGEGPEWLAEQMSSYIVEKALQLEQDGPESGT